MTVYSTQNAINLLTGSQDTDGDTISVYRINGSVISSWPHVLNLTLGSARIYQDGQVDYDDEGTTSGHPSAGQTTSNGTFSFTLWDGADESPTYTASLELDGAAAGAPVLSNGSANATGAASASASAQTDTGNGVFYVVLTLSGSTPSAAQIIAGQDHSGSATFGVTKGVSSAGLQSVAFSGLAPSTTYHAYGVHQNGGSNSNVLPLGSLVTNAAQQATTAYVFGNRTPAGQAGIPVGSFSGGGGHFQFSGGKIHVTSAGAAANLNQGPYSVTINGAPEVLHVVHNACSVDTAAQAEAFINASGGGSTDWTILMRNGTEWVRAGDVHEVMGGGVSTNGTFSDPNSNGYTTTASPETYNKSASASISGGSYTIRPDTADGATIRRFLQFDSDVDWIIDGVVLENVSNVDGRQLIDGGPGSAFNGLPPANVDADAKKELMIFGTNESTKPTNAVIVRNCKIGGHQHGTPVTRWASYFETMGVGHLVLEDNDFDGIFIGCQFASARHAVARRNTVQRRASDLFRSFGTKTAILGAGVRLYCECISNTEWNILGANGGDGAFHWSGTHTDFWQSGTNADQENVHYCFTDNVHIGDVERDLNVVEAEIKAYYNGSNGRPDYRGVDFQGGNAGPFKTGGNQAVFANHQNSPANSITGKLYKDIYVSNALNGVTPAQQDAYDIKNCLIVHAPCVNNTGTQSAWKIRLDSNPAGGATVSNTIYTRIKDSANWTKINNADLDEYSSGNNGYAANFTGAFYMTPNGARVDLDYTSAAALRASLQAAFTPKPGSMAVGKGPYG